MRAHLQVETSLGIRFQAAHCFLSPDPLFSGTTFCGIYLSILFSISEYCTLLIKRCPTNPLTGSLYSETRYFLSHYN